MATTYNLKIDQGVPFEINFRVKNPDNTDKNLTGYSARMQFRTSPGSPTVRLDATTANGKLVIVSPVCSIKLTESDTSTLSALYSYVYDIELVTPEGVPLRLVQGSVTINPEVTR